MSALREALLETAQAPAASDQELRGRLLELLLQPPRKRRMTYEEFLDWADEDTHAEWVDGEVVMKSPASRRHQQIAFFLAQVIGLYAERRGLGTVLIPPFQISLSRRGREPDLLFVAQEHLGRLQEMYLDGPADLVVEIVSSGSIALDRGEKFSEYEEAGVPEYWLIDPLRERAEFYQLDTGGRYRLVAPDEDGIYHSRALESFWLRVAWLWQPPQVWDVIRELGMIEEIR
jgi:Uma2 family endonuclease